MCEVGAFLSGLFLFLFITKRKSTQQKRVAAASPSVPFFFFILIIIYLLFPSFSLATRAIPKPLSQSKYQSFWFLLVPQYKRWQLYLPSLFTQTPIPVVLSGW